MSDTTTPETQTLSPQVQALNVLITAVKIAQSKGAYSLDEAEAINKAIKIFVVPVDKDATLPTA